MRSSARSLPALKIPIRRRGAALAGSQLVGVHAQAHRAACGTPLEPGILENEVETFRFRLSTHAHRAGYDHGPHCRPNLTAGHDTGGEPQIFDPAIRAGTDEYSIDRD